MNAAPRRRIRPAAQRLPCPLQVRMNFGFTRGLGKLRKFFRRQTDEDRRPAFGRQPRGIRQHFRLCHEWRIGQFVRNLGKPCCQLRGILAARFHHHSEQAKVPASPSLERAQVAHGGQIGRKQINHVALPAEREQSPNRQTEAGGQQGPAQGKMGGPAIHGRNRSGGTG